MRELDAKTTKRAKAMLWTRSPVPMVTVVKTFDITRLVRVSKRRKLKLNMLLCYLIGKAASSIEEFYLLVKEDKLYAFDKLAINVIVDAKDGINDCDIPYSPELEAFNQDYLTRTKRASESSEPVLLNDEYNIIGTSAVTGTEIDAAINQYTGIFTNPFLVWGRYRKTFVKYLLPISMQFHHTQMDGKEAALFLETLQREIKNFKL